MWKKKVKGSHWALCDNKKANQAARTSALERVVDSLSGKEKEKPRDPRKRPVGRNYEKTGKGAHKSAVKVGGHSWKKGGKNLLSILNESWGNDAWRVGKGEAYQMGVSEEDQEK